MMQKFLSNTVKAHRFSIPENLAVHVRDKLPLLHLDKQQLLEPSFVRYLPLLDSF
jgi:hypothetical protein